MTSPRLATYSIGGTTRYGAVTDAGIIDLSARNKLVVFLGTALALAWGVWSVRRTPLDALPDLSDTQVIIAFVEEGLAAIEHHLTGACRQLSQRLRWNGAEDIG